jgi:hypothetical protein
VYVFGNLVEKQIAVVFRYIDVSSVLFHWSMCLLCVCVCVCQYHVLFFGAGV